MIYNTIKDVAANQGISIYRIEKDLEFPNGLISKWNKSTPSASNLAKVAKYLGVTTEKLLGDGQKGDAMNELVWFYFTVIINLIIGFATCYASKRDRKKRIDEYKKIQDDELERVRKKFNL